jgi:signal transduction histidine kinase/DNA-binding response OmpR family regulator
MYKPNILIVDDKLSNLVALEAILHCFDVNFIRATSGQEALQKSLENDIALMISDVQMPEMDGFETVKIMKSFSQTKDIPVIFVSAIYSDDFYRIKGIESGGIDFLTKPIIPEILVGKVRLFLSIDQHKHELEKEVRTRTKIAELMEESNKQYEAVFKTTPIGLWERDFSEVYIDLCRLKHSGITDLRAYFLEDHNRLIKLTDKVVFTNINNAILDLFKAKSKDDLYNNIDKIVSSEFYTFLLDEILAFADGKSEYSGETIMYNLNRDILYLSIHWVEIPFNDSKYSRVLFSFINNTTMVEQKIALIDARDKAEQATKAKANFLATMSHEIRTPMNGVIGMTDLLANTTLTEEQFDYVNTIKVSGYALLTIINDILDFSKIESGKMELEKIEFSIQECLDQSLDILRKKISEKKLQVMYFIDHKIPEFAIGDIVRLRQIIVNLINNAIKFTSSGGIYINVTCTGLTDKSVSLNFSVRDTGVGISDDKIKKLFKAFSQADSSVNRRYGGTGLGLAICKSLVELMNGTINVASKQEEGSNFYFDIELPLPSKVTKRISKYSKFFTKTHVIDPNNLSSSILKQLSKEMTREVDIFDSLDHFVKNNTLTEKNIIIVNSNKIPRLSKLFLEFILINKEKIKLITIDSYSNEAVKVIDEKIVSPIKNSTFKSVYSDIVNSKLNTRKPTKLIEKDLSKSYPHTILLAEDNPINQKLAKKLLLKMGYEIDIADNGNEVIRLYNKKKYDIIFMDIQMPEMDGLATSQYIRTRIKDREIVIIAMTANAMQGDEKLCLEAGMNDYLPKPLNITRMQEMLKKY